jgi:hypothetical protein
MEQIQREFFRKRQHEETFGMSEATKQDSIFEKLQFKTAHREKQEQCAHFESDFSVKAGSHFPNLNFSNPKHDKPFSLGKPITSQSVARTHGVSKPHKNLHELVLNPMKINILDSSEGSVMQPAQPFTNTSKQSSSSALATTLSILHDENIIVSNHDKPSFEFDGISHMKPLPTECRSKDSCDNCGINSISTTRVVHEPDFFRLKLDNPNEACEYKLPSNFSQLPRTGQYILSSMVYSTFSDSGSMTLLDRNADGQQKDSRQQKCLETTQTSVLGQCCGV